MDTVVAQSVRRRDLRGDDAFSIRAAPRPYTRSASSREGMKGGTVSMWVEKTISGRGCSGAVA